MWIHIFHSLVFEYSPVGGVVFFSPALRPHIDFITAFSSVSFLSAVSSGKFIFQACQNDKMTDHRTEINPKIDHQTGMWNFQSYEQMNAVLRVTEL